MSQFHEVLFPKEISYGSAGGPKFKTTIFASDSGYEQRNIEWSEVRAEYDVSHGIKSREQMEEIREFFMARRGRAYGFRFLDYADYRLSNQVIGVGDGVQTEFQLIKTYRSQQTESGSDERYDRTITKPVWDTVSGVQAGATVLTAPADYSVDYDSGVITLTSPLGVDVPLSVGQAEFHVPVRFDTDHLDVTHDFWETQSWPNIPLVELRRWEVVQPT